MSARVMLMVRCREQRPAALIVSDEAFDCDEWWLVEAESADAARKAIKHFEHNGEPCVHGRVLAQGGKR